MAHSLLLPQGWDVREQSLSLLQQWGLAFQAKQDVLPYFYETYMKLRLKVPLLLHITFK